MKTFFAFCSILILQACATVPVSYEKAISVSKENALMYQEKKSEDDASLVIIRDRGLVGSACKTKILVDGKLVGQVGTSEKLELWLAPKEYMLAAKPAGICAGGIFESEVVLKAKQKKIYRISMSQNGELRLAPTSFGSDTP